MLDDGPPYSSITSSQLDRLQRLFPNEVPLIDRPWRSGLQYILLRDTVQPMTEPTQKASIPTANPFKTLPQRRRDTGKGKAKGREGVKWCEVL